jgi:hypothetical protein
LPYPARRTDWRRIIRRRGQLAQRFAIAPCELNNFTARSSYPDGSEATCRPSHRKGPQVPRLCAVGRRPANGQEHTGFGGRAERPGARFGTSG